MMYCSRCGRQLEDDVRFCPSCGTRTPVAVSAGVNYPPIEDLREAFSRAGDEMEKAFSMAAQEINDAFKSTTRTIRDSVGGEPLICPQCGTKNSSGASYCSRCGKKLS